MNPRQFKFRHQLRVRNYEVDLQGIVHSAMYLFYFEVGRIEYLKNIGISVTAEGMQNNSKVVLVRNEIDYRSPARFHDLLSIATRVSYIRKSSSAFEGFIEEATTQRMIAESLAVHVWLDPRTNEPRSVDDEFRKKIQQFEGGDAIMNWQTMIA